MAAVAQTTAAHQLRAAHQLNLPPKLALPLRVIASSAAICAQMDARVPVKVIVKQHRRSF